MKEQQPWLLRQGNMQLMILGAKHSDGCAFLLQCKHLAIGEERRKAFFLAWPLCWPCIRVDRSLLLSETFMVTSASF